MKIAYGFNRAEPRYPSSEKIEFCLHHPSASADYFTGSIMNISNSGLCIETEKALETSQRVYFADRLPNNYKTATVRWIDPESTPGNCRAGLLCADINGDTKAAERMARRISGLHSLGCTVNSSLSPDQVVNLALKEMAQICFADCAFIYLNEGAGMSLKGAWPDPAGLGLCLPAEKKMSDCLCGVSAEAGMSIYSSNIFDDGRCVRTECRNAGIRSVAALPLRGRDRTLGVLGIASMSERDFHKEEIFLETLASHISIALQNALTHKRLVRYAEELEENRENFRQLYEEFVTLLNTIPDDLSVYNSDLRVQWANRVVHERHGMDVLQMYGSLCYETLHGRSEPCEPCVVLKSLRSGREENERVKTSDGIVWDYRAVPVKDAEGRTVKVIKVGRNITEQLSLEAQYRQAQKMEAIGLLAGGIAHDFNNMLTAIMGYGNLLRMKMQKTDPLVINVDQILSSSERAAQLTQSLLAFSRKQIMNPKPVVLSALTGRFEKLLSRVIGEDIELKTVSGKGNHTVMADSGQIEQVLMNLSTNARDAMPRGGRLTIEIREAEIDDSFVKRHGFGKHGPYVCIGVSDTGDGMDENTRQRIFEPFFTTKEVGKGTGLGLSIVYGIIKQHGGYVSVLSSPGEGSTFEIYLPAASGGLEETAQAQDEETLQGGNETVLLAEDDPQLRTLTSTILTEVGYRVIEAVDGEDALGKFFLHQESLDLLILDVIMPKKNGKELFDEIRATRPGVKAVFMTGYTADIIQAKGIADENLDVIWKPASPKDILSRIRQVLDRPAC